MTEFASGIPASLQATLTPAFGTGIEVPSILYPTLEIPLTMQTCGNAPAGGVDLRAHNESALVNGFLNIPASQVANAITLIIFDKGVYRIRGFIHCFTSVPSTFSQPFVATMQINNPEFTAAGFLALIGGVAGGVAPGDSRYQDFGVFQFSVKNWTISITTVATGVGQVIGLTAALKIDRLL